MWWSRTFACLLWVLSVVVGVGCKGEISEANRIESDAGISNSAPNCFAGQQACGGRCANLASSKEHCGACDRSCGAGDCVEGECQCRGSETSCGGSCVDTAADEAHCGSCGKACAPGALCTGGTCECPQNGKMCGKACVDISASMQHCGDCDKPCAASQMCSGGSCRSAMGADNCDGAAKGLRIAEVSVYQSVKIPIARGGASIPIGQRVASLVQGRETLVRVFVDLDSSFVARTLSARLAVTNGNVSEEFFTKKSISVTSTELDIANSFQIFVPGDRIQESTRYSVEVVECGASTGQVLAPRAPALGSEALGARKTGRLRVRVVPITSNAHTPDTSETTLGAYRALMMAMYPIDSIELSLASGIITGYPLNWLALLDQVRAKRQSDAPEADVYYYGFVQPTDTFAQYCGTSCTAGIGYVATANQAGNRAAVGIAYGDAPSLGTMAHEVGHNHGRNHAPCAPGNNISGVDSAYPYAGALTGVWGYDSRSRVLFDPSRTTDIMGYCSNKWISDYTYRGITDRVADINAATEFRAPVELMRRFRVLLLDGVSASWGMAFDKPGLPFGEPESATVLDVAGNAIAEVTVYRAAVADFPGYTLLIPEPRAGWWSIRVAGVAPVAFEP